LKGWHCEEDAEGVITAITESRQWSQTYTFHSQHRQLDEKELLETKPSTRCVINGQEKAY